MNSINTKCLVILLAILGLINCKKPSKVESNETPWVEHSQFSGRDRVLLNSYADSVYLQVAGVKRLSIFDKNLKPTHWTASGDYGILDKPPLMPFNYIQRMGTNPYSDIEIFPVPDLGRVWDKFNITALDTTCHSIRSIRYFNGECILSNENKQILVPYTGLNTNGESINKYILATLENSQVKETKVIIAQNSRYSISWNSYGEDFYLGDISSTYKVRSNGDSYKVSDVGLNRIFYLDETLWGITAFGAIYTSKNNGEDWNRFSANTMSNWANLYYKNVNGRVFAFYRSKLYEVTHSVVNGNSTLSVNEIDNTGLENTEITSISYFKGKYYLTTYNGLFSKKEEYFATKK